MFIPSWQAEMCERAAKHVPVPEDWMRAGGDVICKTCNRPYFDHPNAVPHLWLRVLCNGKYVKL